MKRDKLEIILKKEKPSEAHILRPQVHTLHPMYFPSYQGLQQSEMKIYGMQCMYLRPRMK